MEENADRKSDIHIKRLLANAVSLGGFMVMFDTFCNSSVRGIHQWRWHGTTLFDDITPAKP